MLKIIEILAIIVLLTLYVTLAHTRQEEKKDDKLKKVLENDNNNTNHIRKIQKEDKTIQNLKEESIRRDSIILEKPINFKAQQYIQQPKQIFSTEYNTQPSSSNFQFLTAPSKLYFREVLSCGHLLLPPTSYRPQCNCMIRSPSVPCVRISPPISRLSIPQIRPLPAPLPPCQAALPPPICTCPLPPPSPRLPIQAMRHYNLVQQVYLKF